MGMYIDLRSRDGILAVLMMGISIYLSVMALIQLSDTFLHNINNPFIKWSIIIGISISIIIVMIIPAVIFSILSPIFLIISVILVAAFGFAPGAILFMSFSILSFVFYLIDTDR